MELIFYILIGICFAIFLIMVYTFFVKRADIFDLDGVFFGKLVKKSDSNIFSTHHEGKVGDTSEFDSKAFIRQINDEGYSNAPVKKGYVIKTGEIFDNLDRKVASCDPKGKAWFGLFRNILPGLIIIIFCMVIYIWGNAISFNWSLEKKNAIQVLLACGIFLFVIGLLKSYFTRKTEIFLTDNQGNISNVKIGYLTYCSFKNTDEINQMVKAAGCMALYEAFETSQSHKDVGRLPSFSAKDLAFPAMLLYFFLFSLLANFILGIDRSNLQQEGFSYASVMILIYGMIWYFMYILKTDMGNQNQTFYPLLQIINRNTGIRGWNVLLIFISALATILTITGLTKGNNVGGFVFFPLFLVIFFATLYNFINSSAAQWQLQEPVDRILNPVVARLGRLQAPVIIPQGEENRLEFNWDLSKTKIDGLTGVKQISFDVKKSNFNPDGKVRKENPFYGKDANGKDNWKQAWEFDQDGKPTGLKYDVFNGMIKQVLEKNPQPESENELIDKIVSVCKSVMVEHNLPYFKIFDLVTTFCQEEIDYKADADCGEINNAKEYVRFPIETLVDGRGDCDCYSALAYKILKRLNLQPDDLKYAYCFENNNTGKHAFLLLKKNGSIPFPDSFVSYSIPKLGGMEYVFCECTIRPWKVGVNNRFSLDKIQIIDL